MIAASTDTVATYTIHSVALTRVIAVCQLTITEAIKLSKMLVGTGNLLAKYTGTTFSFSIDCTATTDSAASAVISVNNSLFYIPLKYY